MQGALIVGIVMGGIILGLAVVGVTLLMAINAIRGGFSRKERERYSQETKMIQELYQGLGRMEKRVEALETLLLEGEKDYGKKA